MAEVDRTLPPILRHAGAGWHRWLSRRTLTSPTLIPIGSARGSTHEAKDMDASLRWHDGPVARRGMAVNCYGPGMIRRPPNPVLL